MWSRRYSGSSGYPTGNGNALRCSAHAHWREVRRDIIHTSDFVRLPISLLAVGRAGYEFLQRPHIAAATALQCAQSLAVAEAAMRRAIASIGKSPIWTSASDSSTASCKMQKALRDRP